MIRYLTEDEVIAAHDWAITAFGGKKGIRDRGLLDSAVHQPQHAFSGKDAYPTVADKAAALGFSIIQNNAFEDGNKRTGIFCINQFLECNGYSFSVDTEEAQRVVLGVASSEISRELFATWIASSITPKPTAG